MPEIKASIEINASVDKVWEVVSDLDNDPKFWTCAFSLVEWTASRYDAGIYCQHGDVFASGDRRIDLLDLLVTCR